MSAQATLPTTIRGPIPEVVPTAHRKSEDRFGAKLLLHFKRWFGPPSQRRLAYAALQIPKIRHFEKEFSKLTDEEVLSLGKRLKGRARGGESLVALLPEVFGLVCVAALRNLKMRPYDVQLAAGVVLHYTAVAEVSTGEGKTLVATAPVALNALTGRGVHVTTTNDYLAKRDGENMSLVYNALGLTVGVLQQKMEDDQRKAAYAADITYGTASEFGFDFLRDRLKVADEKGEALPFWSPWTQNGTFNKPMDPKVQRGHHFALVDEADNIFIDDAKTPLIIGGPSRDAMPEEAVPYVWADDVAQAMVPNQHFMLDQKKHKIELTEDGRQLVRYSNPPVGEHSHAMDKLHEHVERALHARFRFRRDQHYMVDDGKIVIIDESTGRPQPDRHWRDGLHQAVEAKERVQITMASDHAAQITLQRYFRLYDKLCGMTGTAAQNWWELLRVYKLWTVCVPTNRPIIREHRPDKIFPTVKAKIKAIVEEIKEIQATGRPILVGTRSVDMSERISEQLQEEGITHQVLNARPDIADKEAEIVAQAGRPHTVTIATNMAGRGTDIILGGNAEPIAWNKLKEEYQSRLDVPREVWSKTVKEIEEAENLKELQRQVVAAGGLHVLGTERHDSLRIDRQLQGRAGRQGDPGSCQFFLSLEDEILEGLGQKRQEAFQKFGQRYEDEVEYPWEKFLSEFQRAQRRTQARHYRQRIDLMNYEKNRWEILKDIGADPYVD